MIRDPRVHAEFRDYKCTTFASAAAARSPGLSCVGSWSESKGGVVLVAFLVAYPLRRLAKVVARL
jgi:hypothetical protein